MNQNNKRQFKVWQYIVGLLSVITLVVISKIDYVEYIERNPEVGTKNRMLKLIIQKLDSIGGPSMVYGFFGLIALFFVYKIYSGMRSKNEEENK